MYIVQIPSVHLSHKQPEATIHVYSTTLNCGMLPLAEIDQLTQ